MISAYLLLVWFPFIGAQEAQIPTVTAEAGEPAQAVKNPADNTNSDTVQSLSEIPDQRTLSEWHLREMALMARVRSLELELAQEQALRFQREQEWFEFTKLLTLLPEERRPDLPEFLESGKSKLGSASGATDPGASEPDPVELRAVRRAQELKTSLRAYLRAEGARGLDILEVGALIDGGIGPIVARQLDSNGRLLATLVADRLRLEKSDSGYTVTVVLEGGYERRGGQVWPFPVANGKGVSAPVAMETVAGLATQQELRVGVLRIPLAGVNPAPWIEVMPELFRSEDLIRLVDDGSTNLIALRFSFNKLLENRKQGARWRLVTLGGIVEREWRDVHMAELNLQSQVVRRLFTDRLNLRVEGNNVIFEMKDGAQERNGVRTPFLAGRYSLVFPGADIPAWQSVGIPGL